MKYKIEYWKYDIFDFDEAEQHLNQMAEKGWQLSGLTLEWMPLACYRNCSTETPKKYAIAFTESDEEDERLIQLYHDAGWKLEQELNRYRQCIFSTEEQDLPPLYTDKKSKTESALQSIKDSTNFVMRLILWVLLLIATIWIYKQEELYSVRLLVLLIMVPGLLDFFVVVSNYHYIKKGAQSLVDSGGRPAWIKAFNRFYSIIGLILVASMLTLFIVVGWTRQVFYLIYFSGFSSIFFLLGSAIRVIGKKKGWGIAVMFVGVFLFYFALSRTMDLLIW